jgi:hypothetical protein
MNTKVKTHGGRDAVIINMNGPDPDWPIAAWVEYASGHWSLGKFKQNGQYYPDNKAFDDLMLTTYKYRAEYADETKTVFWWPVIGSVSAGIKVSRGTFDMDGNLIEICLLTDEKIAELRMV